MYECLHRVYRTVCKVCMLQLDTRVSAWLIQTSQTVRSNLHSTIRTKPKTLLPGSPWGWGGRAYMIGDGERSALHDRSGVIFLMEVVNLLDQ